MRPAKRQRQPSGRPAKRLKQLQAMILAPCARAESAWDQLPDSLVDAILCRLPLVDVLHTMPMVCKDWKRRRSSHAFASMCGSISGPWVLVTIENDLSNLCFFHVKTATWCSLRLQDLPVPPGIPYFATSAAGDLLLLVEDLVSSFNRLGPIIVGNPITKKWRSLPLCPDYSTSYAGEFSVLLPSADKVVHIVFDAGAAIPWIFSLGIGSWSRKTACRYKPRQQYVVRNPTSVLLDSTRNRIYFMTGRFSPCGGWYRLAGITVWMYDVEKDEWRTWLLQRPKELDDWRHDYPQSPDLDIVLCRGQVMMLGLCKNRAGARELCSMGLWKMVENGADATWEMISEVPIIEMTSTLLPLARPGDVNVYEGTQVPSISYCSDEEDNIWILMHTTRFMLNFNVATRRWSSIPVCERLRVFTRGAKRRRQIVVASLRDWI